MADKIYPCIWFDGKGKEAAEFYCSILENSSVKTNTGLVVTFQLCGKKFMGLNGGPMFKPNPSVSFFVKCSSVEQTNETWNKLSEGGSPLMPIDNYPWSERYGWTNDKYGVSWQIMFDPQHNGRQTISPSLLFTNDMLGKAEEALRFYSEIFPGSGTGLMARYPESDTYAGKLMYAEYNLAGFEMIAMDGPGDHHFMFNEGVSFVVDCKDQEEVDYYWTKFTSEGGQESMCAWLKDKFGVSWQIVPARLGELIGSPEKEKADRAMQAMLKMKKIIIADLEKAFDGN